MFVLDLIGYYSFPEISWRKTIIKLIVTIIITQGSTICFAKDSRVFEKIIDEYQYSYLLNADIYIGENGQEILNKQVGFADDLDSKKPFTNDTLFPIASLTKQFTAASIMLLVDEGKINLNKPIIRYLPANHRIWQGEVPKWANIITIHQLLTHSSGLSNYTEELWPGLGEEVPDVDFVAIIISNIKQRKLNFVPGSKASYNNTGFIILGEIIAELSEEKNLSKFMQERIFKPLNMSDSYLPSISEQRQMIRHPNSSYSTKVVMRYVANLSDLDDNLIPFDQVEYKLHPVYLVPLDAAGAIISTMADLKKWQEALYGGKLISPKSLKLMTTPYVPTDSYLDVTGKDAFGYGLIISKINGQYIYRHGGWLMGIRTYLSYNKVLKRSVIVLSNLSPIESQPEKSMLQQIDSFTDLSIKLQKAGF